MYDWLVKSAGLDKDNGMYLLMQEQNPQTISEFWRFKVLSLTKISSQGSTGDSYGFSTVHLIWSTALCSTRLDQKSLIKNRSLRRWLFSNESQGTFFLIRSIAWNCCKMEQRILFRCHQCQWSKFASLRFDSIRVFLFCSFHYSRTPRGIQVPLIP